MYTHIYIIYENTYTQERILRVHTLPGTHTYTHKQAYIYTHTNNQIYTNNLPKKTEVNVDTYTSIYTQTHM